jgi:hypothetical protein
MTWAIALAEPLFGFFLAFGATVADDRQRSARINLFQI